MARVRTSVSLGTVAVLVLGGLSLGLGSVTMPGSTTLGGPVVLPARPELQRPLFAALEGTTDPRAAGIEPAAVEAVGVRAPTPIRAAALRTATNGTASHRDPTGTTGTAQTRTTGADTRASTGSTVPAPDVRATGTVTTPTLAPVEPAHAPSAPSRSDEMRGALVSPIELMTSGTSTPEGTRTHPQP